MRKHLGVLSAICMLTAATASRAQSLQVSPTSLELAAGQAATTISIRNSGSSVTVGQIRVMAWSQNGAEEVLVQARDLVASPPAARIAPGTEQIIRIVRPAKAPPPREQSYRILVDEIPSVEAAQGMSVILRIQYSIPVFVLPERPKGPALTWKLERLNDGIRITARNSGDQRSKLVDFALERPDGGKVHAVSGLFGYVLAQSSRSWTIQPGVTLEPGEKLKIAAGQDQGRIAATAAVDADR